MKFLRRLMSDQKVERRYVSAGAEFGDAVNYLYMGECIGFESMLNRWADWEQEYSDRGYKTVPIDDFIELGGYGKSIEHLLKRKLNENEESILHAQIYRDNYLRKIIPTVSLNEMLKGNAQKGDYVLPSTKSVS